MADPTMLADNLARARRWAALSGPFDPVDALPMALADSPSDAAIVASQLARICDTNPPEAAGKWLLRTADRRDTLKSLRDRRMLDEAIMDRRRADPDPATEDLLDAMSGRAIFSRPFIYMAIADELGDIATLERLILALDRAGEVAPSYHLLPLLRSRLANRHRDERWIVASERKLFGRQVERDAIDQWLSMPILSSPVRAIFVRGLPAIGKSMLLDESVRAAFARDNPIILTLDFDRAGHDVQDIVGLTMEAARQIADQVAFAGPALLEARLAAASLDGDAQETRKESQRGFLPTALVSAISTAIRPSGRSILVVLDTLEVLRNRGETHPESLFRWLDQLVDAGVRPMRVVAAGRGAALGDGSVRVGTELDLAGLSDPDADEMLYQMGVAAGDREDLVKLADGNPLVLRLAAEMAQHDGPKISVRERGKKLTVSFLYRFLLSRIDDPQLRRIVHPGLIVRRISVPLIREVLAPKLGLGHISVAEAERLFATLEAQTWLVERDRFDPSFLQHRADMRRVLLPLFYNDAPGKCAKINEAAARWFARQSQPWARVEALYHTLQLMRQRKYDRPFVDRDLAMQIDAAMLSELPEVAQNLLHDIRGERSARFRAPQPRGQIDDASATNEILGLIERQDWIEGAHLINDVIDASGLGPASTTADAIRTFYWRSGRWASARQMLNERDRVVSGDDDLHVLPSALSLARLEMRAEWQPAALRHWLRDDPTGSSFAGEASSRSKDDIGRFGALGFMVAAASPSMYRGVLESDADPVGAAFLLWSRPDSRRSDEVLDRTLENARRRQSARIAIEETQHVPEMPARLLGILNPYLAPVLARALNESPDWISAAAKAADSWLTEAGALLSVTPQSTIRGPDGEQPISAILRLGLFSEWVEATAFLRQDSDLRLIAQSSERWRRTVAGRWSYPGRPRDWPNARGGIDIIMRARLDALLRDNDPQGAAWNQLGLFGAHPAAGPERVWNRLEHRALAHARKAARAKDVHSETLKLLLRHRVPAAFAPAATVIACAYLFPNRRG